VRKGKIGGRVISKPVATMKGHDNATIYPTPDATLN